MSVNPESHGEDVDFTVLDRILMVLIMSVSTLFVSLRLSQTGQQHSEVEYTREIAALFSISTSAPQLKLGSF